MTTVSVAKKGIIFTEYACFLPPQFSMDRANAEEFFEVYKGVVAEYPVSMQGVKGYKVLMWKGTHHFKLLQLHIQ